ncbi:MAG: hypothetical protein JXR13_13060 [Thalassovita sp.]
MTAEALALIAAYFLCSETAEIRVPTQAEAVACVDTYTDVKLLFIDGVTRDDYDALSTREQVEVNQTAYLAYVAWKDANTDLVKKLERDAQVQIANTGC